MVLSPLKKFTKLALDILNDLALDEALSETSFLEELLKKNLVESPWNETNGKNLGNFPNFEIEKLKKQIYGRNQTSLLMMAENPDSYNHEDRHRYNFFSL